MTEEKKAAAFDVAAQYLHHELDLWIRDRALIVGISGPQGSGKSYVTAQLLEYLLETKPHLNCVGLLLDDFYLTHDEQLRVSAIARKAGNPLLQGRGLPGTHDLDLAVGTLQRLRDGDVPVTVPLYDKSAFDGAGDRLEKCLDVDKHVDVVLFEGWMNGFRPIDEQAFTTSYFCAGTDSVVQKYPMHLLAEVNSSLAGYERLWDMFDRFIYLETDVAANVYLWRLQQEAGLFAHTGRGMTDDQVIAFVDRYMPMYLLYFWRMCNHGAAPSGYNLGITIDRDRSVTAQRII